MSFFIRKGGGGSTKNSLVATKRRKAPTTQTKHKKPRRKQADNEEIDSDGSDIEVQEDVGYESEEEKETPEEKKLRLAKLYLQEIQKELEEREGGEQREDEEGGEEAQRAPGDVAARLKEDVEAERGKLRKSVAAHLNYDTPEISTLQDKRHKMAITCVAVSADGRSLYSSSKDKALLKWELPTGTKLHKIDGGKRGEEEVTVGHCSTILALAVSSDNKYLASGDENKIIYVWECDTMTRLHVFRGHRDVISGLVFRRGTHTLYSCSFDRSVKIWSVDDRAYVETLFGHNDKISAIDAGTRERAVTAGGRDGSVRVWKIVEESQLVFNGPTTSIDCVKLLNEEHWVTAGEDGHLAVWGAMKKKPLVIVQKSHGCDPVNADPHWVSALATLHNTDLVCTGSRDGWVRFWSIGEGFRSIKEVGKVQVPGFVNSLSIADGGQTVIAGVGQEHRLGRWWRLEEAKNRIYLIRLSRVEA